MTETTGGAAKGPLRIYGLRKCSTCRKAVTALEEAGHAVDFRDVAGEPLGAGEWREMRALFGEKLVNRASLTWRAMSEDERAADPIAQLEAKPSLMKRPAIIADGGHWLGWTANVRRAFGIE